MSVPPPTFSVPMSFMVWTIRLLTALLVALFAFGILLPGNQDDLLQSGIVLEMGLGALQWGHALYVGFRLKSSWHRSYFYVATGYVAVAILIGVVLVNTPNTFQESIAFLLIGCAILPTLMAIFYAVMNVQYLPKLGTVNHPPSDDNLLDDELLKP